MNLSRESPISGPSATVFPLGVDVREIRLTSIGWALFILCQVAYCTIYTHVVATTSWEFRDMLAWALKEWGFWVVLTPVVFRMARRHEAWLGRRLSRYATLAAGTLAVSLPVRVAIEVLVSGQNAVPSFVVYLPRHLAAVTAILLVWRHFLRDRFRETRAPSARGMVPPTPKVEILPANGHDAPTEPGPESTAGLAREPAAPVLDVPRVVSEPPRPDGSGMGGSRILRVHKGRDECLIPIDEIEFVTSSGNYVDIGCGGQVYLRRATLKQMEELLSAVSLVRVHRRHLVNLRAIERITWRRSGNGVIRLKSGPTLNVSKSCKSRLSGGRASEP